MRRQWKAARRLTQAACAMTPAAKASSTGSAAGIGKAAAAMTGLMHAAAVSMPTPFTSSSRGAVLVTSPENSRRR